MIYEIYAEALKEYGRQAQLMVVVEEMSELGQDVCHLARNDKKVDIEHLAGEIADVQIMLEQLMQMCKIEEMVKEKRCEKIKRLKERLEKRKSNKAQTEE